jgi:16S rRNA (cytosine1402-N4)-methyltransferase
MTHVPVLLDEVAGFFSGLKDGVFLDATLGAGGHAARILAEHKGIKLLGIDRDAAILKEAERNLEKQKDRVITVKGNFRDIDAVLSRQGVGKVCGALYDLGVSSFQLDAPERGFSFKYGSRLDMRMDASQELTAEELVNEGDCDGLETVLREYGEERFSKRIASAICGERERRRIETTTELAELVARAVPPAFRHGRIHPATRTFQALRIAVNDELSNLKGSLEKICGFMETGARLCVISFHSLEDRIVKRSFLAASKQEGPLLKLLTKKPVVAGAAELEANPRSRSAKLRAAERI